jgi:hypothetical protein
VALGREVQAAEASGDTHEERDKVVEMLQLSQSLPVTDKQRVYLDNMMRSILVPTRQLARAAV